MPPLPTPLPTVVKHAAVLLATHAEVSDQSPAPSSFPPTLIPAAPSQVYRLQLFLFSLPLHFHYNFIISSALAQKHHLGFPESIPQKSVSHLTIF